MEKKNYETPEIEVIELVKQPVLLAGTTQGAPQWMDDGEFN